MSACFTLLCLLFTINLTARKQLRKIGYYIFWFNNFPLSLKQHNYSLPCLLALYDALTLPIPHLPHYYTHQSISNKIINHSSSLQQLPIWLNQAPLISHQGQLEVQVPLEVKLTPELHKNINNKDVHPDNLVVSVPANSQTQTQKKLMWSGPMEMMMLDLYAKEITPFTETNPEEVVLVYQLVVLVVVSYLLVVSYGLSSNNFFKSDLRASTTYYSGISISIRLRLLVSYDAHNITIFLILFLQVFGQSNNSQ
ncbi:putative signal peptide protein [Puccinia sorghi]|uniref:Putative signal peptide protein n=1 Tax=Puccinia sorghi TaxID=27349 RepID=A0A0L6V9N0_9BASI|nr:putative signal peptide protein [Puccinia sorghi]